MFEEYIGTELEYILEDFEEDFGKDFITTDEWLSDSEIAAIIEYDNTHEADDGFIEKLRRLATLMEEEY